MLSKLDVLKDFVRRLYDLRKNIISLNNDDDDGKTKKQNVYNKLNARRNVSSFSSLFFFFCDNHIALKTKIDSKRKAQKTQTHREL